MGRPDLVGRRFGLLVALQIDPERPSQTASGTYWRCRCECGRMTSVVQSSLLRRKNTKSCGCLQHRPEAARTLREQLPS